MPTDWSPDGRFLASVESSSDKPFALWAIPLDGAAPFALRPGEGTQVGGRFSPDGRALAYVRRALPTRSGEPPDREIWICDFPSGANPRLFASAGMDPAWPSNGSVSYLDRTGGFTILPTSRTGVPVVFRPGVNTPEASRNNYAWAAGGGRLLVNKPLHEPASYRIKVRFDHY
jgi:Tol biopolymer transport system component